MGKFVFVDQLLGEVQAAGLRNGAGRCSQVAQEQAAKMTRADAEAFRQSFDAAVVQSAFAD